MAPHESDPRADDAHPSSKFNPRLVPPLILLGLLLVVGLFALLSRGGPAKNEKSEKVEGRLVRKVEQTPDFTYLEVADDKGPLWLATHRVEEVKVGDRVYYEPDAAREFRNFPAPSLKRTFDSILFVTEVFKVDADGQPVALRSKAGDHGDEMDAAHGHGGMGPHGTSAAADLKVPMLQKAEGGQTLAEIAAAPAKYSGQTVNVRGMIVKAQQRVRPALGQPATNWYRLQDSSGEAEPLLFTADDALQQGDVVVITGKLALDRDFGGGLRYKMIVEGASVTREKPAEPAETPAKSAGPSPMPKNKEKAP